jgi:diguanylate cyclase (GGDEF)-like protein
MTADVGRSHRPLACVVLGPSLPLPQPGEESRVADSPPDEEQEDELSRTLARLLLSLTRISDAVGRSGESDFVILAPGTDQEGAIQLAERITRAVEGDDDAGEDRSLGMKLKAGLYAVSGTDPDTVIPEEMLRRASTALQSARAEGNGTRVYPFSELTE